MHMKIGLLSFGGGITALIHHEVVGKRRWLTEAEFFSGLAICQILPGTNVANLAVFIGQKMRGIAGATVALVSLLLPPFFLLIGFALFFDRISGLSWVSSAIAGITASSIGLLFGMVVRGARASPGFGSWFVLVATAIAVGALRQPFVAVVAVMAPISIGLAYLNRADDA